MPEREPAISDSVHYVSMGSPVRPDGTQEYSSQCRAAIVTAVQEGVSEAGGGIVAAAVLNPTGLFFAVDLSHVDAEHHAGGTWHWPCA